MVGDDFMKPKLKTFLLVICLGTLLGILKSPAAEQRGPNVLFLICDDLNCDLGCYGHPQVKSPHIDKLATRGVRFDHNYCQYPLCGPSRASFMTGLYPDQTLIHQNAIYIREHLPKVKTVAQLFRDAGYFATRIGKIFHYNVPKHIGTSGHDDPYSWNQVFDPRGRDVDDEPLIFSLQPGSFGGTLSWLADDGTDEEMTDGMIAAGAIAQLEKYGKNGKPFFLAVGMFRPHTPYVSPKKYFELYPRDQIKVPTEPEGYLATLPEPARKSIRRKKSQINLPDDLARKAIQAYHAAITFADAQVGKVLDALDKNGLADNTIVLFTSDHGYHMGEHGHWQKTTLFENATRIPLIIAGPGVGAKGETCHAPVEMVDLYPTLADLAGLGKKIPKYLSGISILPVLNDPGANLPVRSALTQYETGYSLRTSRYRYTEWGENGSAGNELYDHQTDDAEMVNLAGKAEYGELVNDLSKQLRQRITEAKRPPSGLTQIRFDNRRRVKIP